MHDDGTQETLSLPDTFLSGGGGTSVIGKLLLSNGPCSRDGWIVQGSVYNTSTNAPRGSAYVQVYVLATDGSPTARNVLSIVCSGNIYVRHNVAVGVFDLDDYANAVFQGTVAEDATGGTHVCTMTLSPGAGAEFEVVGGRIVVGNTATAQTASAFVDDGTNVIYDLLNPGGQSETEASEVYTIPAGPVSFATVGTTATATSSAWGAFKVSGTMRLILKVSTAAVSVTQTFAAMLRIKGAMPTVTLNDTIGTSTNTLNTDTVK